VAVNPFTAPLKVPGSGVPRRPIDSAEWNGELIRPKVSAHVEPGRILRFEYDPGPRWLKPATYAALCMQLERGIRETPNKPLSKLMAWTARHAWVWQESSKLVSDTAMGESGDLGDLVGAALELAREAKRRGRIDELGLPIRRRLLP